MWQINNNCEYPANKQQLMIQSQFFLQKSRLVKLKNSQNLSILHSPQQATPVESTKKVSTQTSWELINT